MCDPETRTETYLVHLTELANGTCGAIPDELVRIDGGSDALAPGCTLDAPDAWTKGNCTLSRSFTCVDSGAGTSTQQDDAATRITGKLTATVTGAANCTSTYGLTYTRQ